jgi:hypothetical protein
MDSGFEKGSFNLEVAPISCEKWRLAYLDNQVISHMRMS